jgi:hypothetical protein
MEWIHYMSYFFRGAFVTNALPHFVSGLISETGVLLWPVFKGKKEIPAETVMFWAARKSVEPLAFPGIPLLRVSGFCL